MDLLLAGYGSSDDEDETQKEEEVPVEATSAPTKSSTLFSKLPPPASSSSSASSLFSRLPAPSASSTSSTAKSAAGVEGAMKGGKRTVSLMLPIPKEALRDDYEDEFMRSNGPALPEAPKATGLSALLPAPKNPNPTKRPRLAPPSVTRRQAESDADKPATPSVATTTTKSSTETAAEVSRPATTATAAAAASTASRAPARSLRALAPQPSAPAPAPAPAPVSAATADPYAGAEAYQHGQYYDQQQQQYYYGQDPSGAYGYAGYEQAGYGYAQQQPQEAPQYLPQDLPEPPPEFTREWEHLARGAKIVDVSQAQITDTSGWSKEFIQQNLAKASSGVSAKDRPGGMQRRKHQITSLAFEAKQRELELLNQRATAQRTKSETWGKYGW